MRLQPPSPGSELSFHRTTAFVVLAVMIILYQDARAQNTSGRWSASLRAGISSFITDFNVNKTSFGVEGRGMYGISSNVSVGALLGYEELKTYLNPNSLGLPYDYVKLHAFPFAAFGTYHAVPGSKIAPYFSAGIGLMFYQRLDWQKKGLPDDNLNTSILIPVSVGADIYLTKNLSIAAEIGYRALDDKTETVEEGGLDSYATLKAGATLYFGKSDDDDDDFDGLSLRVERKIGTNPLMPDSDGDGLKDGGEVERHRSNPLSADTDLDGVTDGEEVLDLKSDPNDPDSDNDGLNDKAERDLGSNPNNIDSDGDVLTDGEEFAGGSNPVAVDTDADGVSDYLELRTYNTNLTNSDTDADSLSDGDEVTKYTTDPLKADTDGGGAIDGLEIVHGTNPLEPSDDANITMLPPDTGPGKPVLVYGVNFTRSGEIGRGSETALENAFITLILMGSGDFDVISHTDNKLSEKEADRITLQQARAVVDWFAARGIDKERLHPVGMGAREPIAPNDTDAGRAQNRRIELRIKP